MALTQHALQDPSLDGVAQRQYKAYHATARAALQRIATGFGVTWSMPVEDVARMLSSSPTASRSRGGDRESAAARSAVDALAAQLAGWASAARRRRRRAGLRQLQVDVPTVPLPKEGAVACRRPVLSRQALGLTCHRRPPPPRPRPRPRPPSPLTRPQRRSLSARSGPRTTATPPAPALCRTAPTRCPQPSRGGSPSTGRCTRARSSSAASSSRPRRAARSTASMRPPAPRCGAPTWPIPSRRASCPAATSSPASASPVPPPTTPPPGRCSR